MLAVTSRRAATMTPHRRRATRANATVALAACVVAALRAAAHASASMIDPSIAQPGVRPWNVERAELHGLSSNALERASANVETIVDRDCFVVARDGALVHESYYHAEGAGAREAFSVDDAAGALATVLATGIAVDQGLFGLDEPLAKFGLASVERAFGREYAEEVTVRQLLAQTHGGGRRAPGSAFERDNRDDGYLDIIGELIEARSGMKLENWARVHVAEPLGVPELFSAARHSGRASEASLRRGLRASCRDVAKLAQVFVNKGAWLGEDGRVKQLFDPSFALTAMSVSYPSLNQAHGLMTWLHVPTSKTGAKCCKPQTTALACGESAEDIDGPILGVDAPRAPVAIVVGDEGSMIFMMPESRTVVVTLGRTVAGTPACPVAPSDVVSTLGHGRRDDAFLVRTLWSAMSDGLKPLQATSRDDDDDDDAAKSRKSVGTSSAERVWNRWEEKHHSSRFTEDDDADVDDDDAYATRVKRVASSKLRDGVVRDGHATYGEDVDEYDDDDADRARSHRKMHDKRDDDDDDDDAQSAAEAYKARQLAYAHDMQEREYKKYESRIQRDYQDAIKANQQTYQDAMRSAQEEPDAVRRAKLEDEAAAEYMEGVNTIENVGADSLKHLETWRESTMPPDAKAHGRDAKPRLGADEVFDADAKHLETMQRALERNLHEMSSVAARRSAPPLARLGAPLATTTTTTTMRGSCVCGCPNTPSDAESSCFDIDASELTSADQAAQACDAMRSRARLGCPHTGIVQKCGDITGKRGQASKDLECRQVRRCPQTKAEAKSIEFLAAVFDCRANAFAGCAYVPKPCAHSHVLVRPTIMATSTAAVEPSAVRLSRGDVDAERSAAHRFSDHDHVVVRHNALTRWALRASPEVSVGLAVAVLALALVTVASKWPTTVTGGEHPFASSRKTPMTQGPRRGGYHSRGAAPAESAPLLLRRNAPPPQKPSAPSRVVATIDKDGDDEEAAFVNVPSKAAAAPPPVSRPVAVPQPQTFAYAEELRPTVEISPRAPSQSASSASEDDE